MLFRQFIASVALLLIGVSSLKPSERAVLTPVGWWPVECVHDLGDDGAVRVTPEHDLVLHKRSNEHGQPVRRTQPKCDHFLNDTLLASAARKPHVSQRKQFVHGDGWQVYTKQDAGDSVSAFLGGWNVPKNPVSYSGQTLFTFTGLQNIDWVPPQPEPTTAFDIIQPVLQYGPSAAGGGNYWSIASWYVTLGRDVAFSKLKRVEAGAQLFGNMTLVDADTWFINTVDTSTDVESKLTIERSVLATQPWVYVTLEVYSVFNCNEYPPNGTQISYTNLQLFENGEQSALDFVVGADGQSPPICEAGITIDDASSVTITF